MGVMIQDSSQFNKLVGLYEVPLLEYWQYTYADAIKDSMIKELFSEESTDNPAEAISEMVGKVDFTKWNGEFTYGSQKEGFTKQFTPVVWQAGMAYDRFLLSNAKLINLKDDTFKFALAAARFREACASGIFTYANQAAGYNVNGEQLLWNIVADGKPIASAAHTSAGYDGTQSNLHTLELSEENLETVCQAMFDLKDSNGDPANLQPDTLVVPTALRKKGLEIIGGEGKVDTADNNPNIYHGSMRLIVWKQFRKQAGKTGQPWAVADSANLQQSLKVLNRLESGDDYELISWKDERVQTWYFGALQWLVMGAFDWRPVQFSIPN
ncbi:MAG: Mu-like prophage major head subunit gpT [Pelotomaculum sp. PtaB.Bin104]|nr:MAG: Mu-like prophage major head subunit gpT [Pelotomaculum sp. PtaB.Bin104]